MSHYNILSLFKKKVSKLLLYKKFNFLVFAGEYWRFFSNEESPKTSLKASLLQEMIHLNLAVHKPKFLLRFSR